MRTFLIPLVALVLSACHLDVTSSSHGLGEVDAGCTCGSGEFYPDGGTYIEDAGSYTVDAGFNSGPGPDAGFIFGDAGSSGGSGGCTCGGGSDGGGFLPDAGFVYPDAFPVD